MSAALIIARYTLIEAVRNRLFGIAILGMLAGLGISHFLGRIAVTESAATGEAVMAGLYRFFAVFSACAFVISGMLREYHDKGMEYCLAMDMTRTAYFFGKLIGYSGCAALLAVLYGLPLLSGGDGFAVLIWGMSLFMELLVMVSVSLFFSLSLSQMPAALASVAGFYLLSRSMGTLLLVMNGPLAVHDASHDALDAAISWVGWLLPRLDAYARTAWLLYPGASWRDLSEAAAQSAIYLALISTASLHDLGRKRL